MNYWYELLSYGLLGWIIILECILWIIYNNIWSDDGFENICTPSYEFSPQEVLIYICSESDSV